MTWQDDFLDELLGSTGLQVGQLATVILELDPAEQARLRREAVEREKQEAKDRARALLLRHLNDEQRAQFEAAQRFVAVGSEGGRYCVHLGRQHNIWTLSADNQHTRNHCVHVRDKVPDEDNTLAQTLLLQSNETEFLRIANSR